MNVRLFNFIALVLLAMFFWPYIHKLKQMDLILILIVGLAMPIYDFLFFKDKKD
jgi:threonine/homoserine efflux transporter RhtA